jgi:hypothetical protein
MKYILKMKTSTYTLLRLLKAGDQKTGHLLFGTEKSKNLIKAVLVPQGKLACPTNMKQINTSGSGYHDHNWEIIL